MNKVFFTAGLTMNPVVNKAIESFGWRVTLRMYCGCVVAAIIVVVSIFRPPKPYKDEPEQSDENDFGLSLKGIINNSEECCT